MTKRHIFYFSCVIAIILIATGIPLKSNPGPEDLIAGRNVNMTSSKAWPDPEGDVYLQRQNEPSIAVSSLNELHLLAGANDYRSVDTWESQGNLPGIPEEAAAGDAWLGVFTSYDGGQSWKSKLLPGYITDPQIEVGDSLKEFDAASDPTVRAGIDGLFFYSGIAFDRIRNGNSVIFVCRYKDYNDTESGDAIRYIDTTIVDEGTSGQFADKPWLAVDVPRPGYSDGLVFLVYSTFLGDIQKTVHNKIMFVRSIDGGDTWEKPIKLSESQKINQGTTIAVDPLNGDVYVAWRRFAEGNVADAIMIAKSTDHGQTFTKAEEAAIIGFPFDQPTYDLELGTVQFRSNAFPTMTVDNNHRVYIAWAQREYENGPARIFFTSAQYGFGWPLQARIHNDYNLTSEDYYAEGHMFMPSMTFAAGKLLIAWYDSRFSYRLEKGGNTEKWLTDYYLGEGQCPDPSQGDYPCQWRETIDVRLAQADPGATQFEPSIQVSRYLWGLERNPDGTLKTDADGYLIPTQLQYNPPNYPLFQGGTVPFIGDYIDIAPAPMFINDEGGWRFNTGEVLTESTESRDPFVFYVSWADNRDVHPPADDPYDDFNPWTWYGPPDHENCLPGFNSGMRDQNVYVSRITRGISIGCPANYKPSGAGQKTFIVNVENMTGYPKTFNLDILNPPEPPGKASFLPSGTALHTLTIDVPAYSAISHHVFVNSDSPHTTTVQVTEVPDPELGGDFIGYVYLYLVGEGGSPEESIDLKIYDEGIVNWSSPEGIPAPETNLINPAVFNPAVFNPAVFNPAVFNPAVFNANILNPAVFNTNTKDGSEIVDKIWRVTNSGDTGSSYTLKTIAGDELPYGYYNQLLVYKVHKTPGTDGQCTLQQEEQHELLINIVNPDVSPDISSYEKIVDPELANEDFTNATFSLVPGEEAIVLLRVIDTKTSAPSPGGFVGFGNFGSFIGFGSFGGSSGTSNGTPSNSNPEDYADNVGAVVVSHSSTEGSLVAITLQILPDSLDDGKAGVAYTGETLRAIGGTEPYSWSLYDGSLPVEMYLSGNGEIYGTPKEAGDFSFTVKVTDNLGESDTQKFTLFIDDPEPIKIIMIPPDAPDGLKMQDYSNNVSFDASGGVPPYSWSLSETDKYGNPVSLGLTTLISGSNGEIMDIGGVPQLAGDFKVKVTVTDDFITWVHKAEKEFDLCIMPLELEISADPSSLPDGQLGSPYETATFSVSNAEAVPSWTVKGLPPGLALSPSEGIGYNVSITGTPIFDPDATYPQTYDITVEVTDNFSSECYQRSPETETFTITIHPKVHIWAVEGVDGEAVAATTDSSGNLYVTGFTYGDGTGKDYYTVKYDADGNKLWLEGQTYNGPGNGDDVPSAIAVDSSGVYVTGTSLGDPTGEGQDICTVKYDLADGHIIWENRYDGPSHLGDGGNDLALDSEGNPHGAGFVHRGNVKKHADYTTIKYSRLSGDIIWEEGYDSTRNGNDVATAIAVDSAGNVYVTGKSQESSKNDEETSHDYVTIKYDSSGNFQWLVRDDGPHFGDDEPTDMALYEDPLGAVYIYVTGYTSGDTNGTDYYTVKYDENGTVLWPGGRFYNGTGNGEDVAAAIAVDESTGDVYVTGKSSGTNGLDYATVKYSSDGIQSWVERHDGKFGNDEAVAIAFDGADVYVAGFITTEENELAADKDFFLIKYDTSGNIIWIAQYDGPSGKDDVARDMALSETGIFVVGYSEKDTIPTVFAVVKYDK